MNGLASELYRWGLPNLKCVKKTKKKRLTFLFVKNPTLGWLTIYNVKQNKFHNCNNWKAVLYSNGETDVSVKYFWQLLLKYPHLSIIMQPRTRACVFLVNPQHTACISFWTPKSQAISIEGVFSSYLIGRNWCNQPFPIIFYEGEWRAGLTGN